MPYHLLDLPAEVLFEIFKFVFTNTSVKACPGPALQSRRPRGARQQKNWEELRTLQAKTLANDLEFPAEYVPWPAPKHASYPQSPSNCPERLPRRTELLSALTEMVTDDCYKYDDKPIFAIFWVCKRLHREPLLLEAFLTTSILKVKSPRDVQRLTRCIGKHYLIRIKNNVVMQGFVLDTRIYQPLFALFPNLQQITLDLIYCTCWRHYSSNEFLITSHNDELHVSCQTPAAIVSKHIVAYHRNTWCPKVRSALMKVLAMTTLEVRMQVVVLVTKTSHHQVDASKFPIWFKRKRLSPLQYECVHGVCSNRDWVLRLETPDDKGLEIPQTKP